MDAEYYFVCNGQNTQLVIDSGFLMRMSLLAREVKHLHTCQRFEGEKLNNSKEGYDEKGMEGKFFAQLKYYLTKL